MAFLTLLPACLLPGDISAYCVKGGALVRLCADLLCGAFFSKMRKRKRARSSH